MIHFHGGRITPLTAALDAWKGRHAMVSYAYPEQLPLAAEICQTFCLDNGAFSAWKQGTVPNWSGYADWVKAWMLHPGFEFAVVPDVIGGSAEENRLLRAAWWSEHRIPSRLLAPVWHLHEPLDVLGDFCHYAVNGGWNRVCLGSSGEFAEIGTHGWWDRMAEAMEVVCDDAGRPKCRIHGLRMLDPTLLSQIPFASADSTNVARNIGIDGRWDNGPYPPATKAMRALVLAGRIELHAVAARWNRESRGIQMNFDLVG